MDSNNQMQRPRCYNTKECESPKKQSSCASALTPSTPRIDISRASSHSSHHDSRDSSPENVFEQVGTGTLQDSGVLGYREEGAMDLRSSTEELHFMEIEKGRTEKEKPSVSRFSPNVFKMEEQQPFLLHRRKDSACSEVAAFLCISGRTSRISSVGSQGSANSKLSVLSGVSGISRSPSPHRMLLETSFCGPKPIPDIADGSVLSSIEPSTAKTLEQVILSRKRDPTEAVLAEGVDMKPLFTDGNVTDKFSRELDIRRRKSDSNANTFSKEGVINPPLTSRSISNKRYIPPTDLSKPIVGVMPSGTEYIRIKLKPDHCYSDNGIADNERILEDDQKKPNTLNLDKRSNAKQTTHTKSLRDNISRSPSPSNINFSRKSSFCSIFKLKDTASPDSPRVCHGRKKSGTNSINDCSERSRSKSKERDVVSINATPSKQKSVLDIFKPKKNVSKSKSPSPIDSVPRANTVTNNETNPNRPQLKYYEAPLDGKSIHIPLHTPPEEKQFNAGLNDLKPIFTPQSVIPITDDVSPSTQLAKLNNNCTIIYHNRPKPMPPLKCYRIENPDGSITIPLKSPTEDKERVSICSMEVQRNSSQDSQDTIISAAISRNNTSSKHAPNASLPTNAFDTDIQSKSTSTYPIQQLNAASSSDKGHNSSPKISEMSTKEKKQILFSMKMGSGSQEQVFSTQFSISKTESQSSQLSEPENENRIQQKTDKTDQTSISSSTTADNQINVVKRRSLKESKKITDNSNEYYRHSRYIENPEEILSLQSHERKNENITKCSEFKEESRNKNRTDKEKTGSSNALKVLDRRSIISNDDRGVSSESEKDSEFDSTFTNNRVHTSMMTVEDHESAGLVLQESFEDELPYIPTTLPEERAMGVKLIPMRERASMEMKTCPLERPRSTTPIYPASLDNYCGIKQSNDDSDGVFSRNEKLRISLPKKHDLVMERPPKNRSPRKSSLSSVKNWFEFAEQFNSGQPCIDNESSRTKSLNAEGEPPPLPPRKMNTSKWIDFENIPETKSQPKQITSISQKASSVDKNVSEGVFYSYVKPEECQCECHESERDGDKHSTYPQSENEDIKPLLLQNIPEDSSLNRSNDNDSKQQQRMQETDKFTNKVDQYKP